MIIITNCGIEARFLQCPQLRYTNLREVAMYVERIVIVGAGLTGSILTESLISLMHAVSMERGIVCVDFDKLESRNSVGNHNTFRDGGNNKAALLAARFVSNGLNAGAIQQRITTKNYRNILRPGDLLVGAVDNIEARVVMWEAAVDIGIPYIDIGINNFSFVVSWVYGAVDTMPYSPALGIKKKEAKEEKQPPCELIASRIQAVIAVELATKSIGIFLKGADPAYIVKNLNDNYAENGDMVGWRGTSTGSEYSVKGEYFGKGGIK
jgi:molybdopterin/thiamine biosynthesis adenylyltransferase